MILKRPKAGAVSGDEAIGLRNEYEIISRHRLSCMLPLIGLVGAFPETGLLFRDVGGQTCDQLERLDQDGLIALADSVATAIGEVHAAGILHRDIRPSNILLTSGRAYILDFARALVGSREHKDIDSPWAMANSLVYLAPEQTGRMNRPVDYRADYYGFGVMLYELASGTPPFRADDPLHLIYDHLATDPIPPERINPAMSSFLSDVVLKLLAKDPDRRYQSVDGLKADLKVAGTIARGDGAGTATVGAFDIPFRFNVSHRLYGRDQERTTLLACFDRVCQGAREMLLIAGYSGVGKTALIRETYIPVTRQKAFFIAGKFDQLQRRQPYGAWIEALRKLMAFVLAEPEARLQSWREHLTTALGQNSGVLMEMIPDLAALLGPQPPPAELPPAEALNRFNQAFRAFIGAFCVPERPLVVFLDDLQWIDAASLNLLSLLTGDPECRYLFLIGACRDNEVSPTHPLMLALVEMKRAAVFSFNEITLPPLAEPHVEHLIADTFAVSVAEARPLARVIGARTAGNPFFLWQFLRTARAEGLVFFDTSAMRWTWRLEAIRQLDCADNVVDLMLYRFNELPPPTRTSLSWAACLGARFDLDTLAILLGVSLPETYATLLPALEQEFVLPLSAPEVASSRLVIRHYRFLHDRMQEAAYRAIVEEERPVSHRRIASLLLANTAEDKLHDRIFEIADHLNLAAPLLVTIDDRLKLARINLMAGRKARESAAYDAALAYLRAGMADLPTDLWESELDLARALHRERGDLEYLNSHFDQAEAFVREALIRETDPLHRADFFHMLVVQYTLRAIYGRAIATAREGLRLLSVDLPEDDFEAARDKELRQVRTLLDGRPLSALADLPVMEDPVQHAVMKLLTSMGPPCYRSHPRLWGVIVAREVRLCLEHGNVPSASYSYPAFGGLLTHVGQGTAGDCADLAAVTLTLMARFASPADTSVGYLMIGSSLRHWFAPLKDASRDYLDAYKTGLDSGNLQYAVYGFGHNTYCRFYQGVPLGELIRETEGYREFCLKRNNLWGIDLTEGALRVFTTLREAEGPHDFSWRGEPEAAYLERCEAHENLQVLCIYHILRAEALLHLERFEAAATSLGEAARRLDSVSTQGLLPTSQFHLLRG
ncbi:MAG: serine/threonine-protein kinase PknK, partial [Alphaproteobacteria bacterium]|nr:serine/threonine-protein kinase PknK [Alphaproteobacteria bacterium]